MEAKTSAMKKYSEMTAAEMKSELEVLKAEYKKLQGENLSLNMARGRPSEEQLCVAEEILSDKSYVAENGFDCRNYGLVDGIPEVKRMFAQILEVPAENVFVGGNSSLSLMYDCVIWSVLFGNINSEKPWKDCGRVKFLCPVPGYDRHFAICEELGIEMINVPLGEEGPDMDMVERLVAEDESIKGIWCVPKYSNPTGITYSDETVKRFAALKPAAKDFRIFWDNAYCVHDLDVENPDKLLNLYTECEKSGSLDMCYIFSSTSKISFAGGGVSCVAASKGNIAEIKKRMTIKTIGYDKLNQLHHARYFKDLAAVKDTMDRHSKYMKVRFDAVLETLEKELSGCGIAKWTSPRGGYFISFDTVPHCAKRVVALCKEAGVVLTGAGATFPYGKDDNDSNIRIAPSCPTPEELLLAAKLFSLCVKIASLEKMIG